MYYVDLFNVSPDLYAILQMISEYCHGCKIEDKFKGKYVFYFHRKRDAERFRERAEEYLITTWYSLPIDFMEYSICPTRATNIASEYNFKTIKTNGSMLVYTFTSKQDMAAFKKVLRKYRKEA